MKYKFQLSLILLALVALVLSSGCFKNWCIDGNGVQTTETRLLTPFSGIHLEGSFDVTVTRDSVYRVVVEAEENLLPYIITRVNGPHLEIRNRDNRCVDNNYPIRIKVYTPVLEYIDLSGSGDIFCDSLTGNSVAVRISGSGSINSGVRANYLNASITGSGSMDLWGTNNESDFEITGSGDIRSYNLKQDNCYATITGSGDMFLYVVKLLDVKISGSGSVHYKGNPILKTKITGSGNVFHH